MWISNFAIRRPVITTVVTLSLVSFGLLALSQLDTDEFPNVEPPVVSAVLPYPGASPRTVERELIEPIEEAITAIEGVDEVQSSALDSLGVIIVEFRFGTNLQQATQDIRDKISEIRRDLPTEMEEPVLTRFDPNDLPIVSLTLSSPQLSPAELTRLADPALTGELRSVPGVAEVRLVGASERELTVNLRPSALWAAGLSVSDVVSALQAQNLAAPVGRVTSEYEERTIRLRGRFAGPTEFEQMVVRESGGDVVRLGQVAEVRDGAEESRSAAFYNEARAVGIDVIKASDASTSAVSEAVRRVVAQLKTNLPEGVALRVVRDAGTRVEHSVRDVELHLLVGAMLTVLVVFLFLRSWRSTVITGLALPVSVLASFIAVAAFGFTLNTMSLLGLSLAIGILIDDAIVVRENIVRHMEMGKDHHRAAREGTAEIGLAVAATTFSIVVVFVPIALMGGVAQQWFAPFALTIACSVLVSLFVSFSLDPMLSAYWPDPSLGARGRGPLGRLLDRFNDWLDRSTSTYQRAVGWALDHRISMAAIAVLSFVGALALPALGLVGSEFLPRQDRSEILLELEAPPGSNLSYTAAKSNAMSRLARALPEVAYTYTAIGGQTGEAVDEASIYVRLLPKSERDRGQEEVEADLRRRAEALFGATVSVSPGMFGGQKQIQLQLKGPNLDTLGELAQHLANQVREVPGAADVGLSSKGQKPELEVTVDRGLAGRLGISAAEIGQSLRIAFAGLDAGDWIDPEGETRDVRVQLAPPARQSRADLEALPLGARDPAGGTTLVPLTQVARVQAADGPVQINHLERERVITVEANAQDRPLSEVLAGINQRTANLELPAGYTFTHGGEAEDQQEVFTRIFIALGAAVLLMYVVLVIQFNSFLDPIAVMASLPLSLIGVMLALLMTGTTLNLMSLIGVILLMGIVAKNAILLIDFAKWSKARGVPRREAIIEAGGVRLRPIIMTSVAIVAGMLPVALGFGEGAGFRAPLGRAVIGGVITSTLLTLLIIPSFFETLDQVRDWARGKAERRRAGSHALPAHDAGGQS